MTDFIIWERASRKLRSVTPIPWAEPAPPTAQDYPSWVEPPKFDQGGLGRKLQRVELNEFPGTVVPDEPLTAYTPSGFNFNSGLDRTLQRLKLREYPATPAGYYSGYYPGSKRVEPLYKSSNYTLQTVPELNTYPQAAADEPLPAFTPSGFNFNPGLTRALQTVELNEFPATPAAYYSGYYPGSGPVTANFKQSNYNRIDLPELNSYPATPALVPYSSIVKSGFNFNSGLSRKRLGVELNEFPATPAGYYSGYYPGSKLAEGFRTKFDRKLQTVELNEYPAPPTSPAILPAFMAPDVFYRAGKRNLLYLPEQNSYPATPTPSGVWTVQDNDDTIWSVQVNDSTTWTVQ
jgi:hypothetical protein